MAPTAVGNPGYPCGETSDVRDCGLRQDCVQWEPHQKGHEVNRCSRVFASLLVALAGALALAPPPAQAARASTGEVCTILGTRGSDVLTGTTGPDVICGLGGRDLIRGKRGSDVIDAGPGPDTVYGGAGDDRLLGGRGADTLRGDDGDDILRGGAGRDLVSGGADGDKLSGGRGGDNLAGDQGEDRLVGRTGNDDLTGGVSSDQLLGGDGTDWCTVNSQDVEKGCVPDLEDPLAVSVGFDADSADVTNNNVLLAVRAYLTDDTGVEDVRFGLNNDTKHLSTAHGVLSRGTVRDGWWETDMLLPRYAEPGDYWLRVDVRDRAGRTTSLEFRDQVFHLIDDDPDTERPIATLLAPAITDVVDVRAEGRDVTVRARVTDAKSGVLNVSVCLWKPYEDRFTNLQCEDASRTSGTDLNGVYQAVVRIPRGDTGGRWNVSVEPSDRAHPGLPLYWAGPDLYAVMTENGPEPDWALLPTGAGWFTVLGAAP